MLAASSAVSSSWFSPWAPSRPSTPLDPPWFDWWRLVKRVARSCGRGRGSAAFEYLWGSRDARFEVAHRVPAGRDRRVLGHEQIRPPCRKVHRGIESMKATKAARILPDASWLDQAAGHAVCSSSRSWVRRVEFLELQPFEQAHRGRRRWWCTLRASPATLAADSCSRRSVAEQVVCSFGHSSWCSVGTFAAINTANIDLAAVTWFHCERCSGHSLRGERPGQEGSSFDLNRRPMLFCACRRRSPDSANGQGHPSRNRYLRVTVLNAVKRFDGVEGGLFDRPVSTAKNIFAGRQNRILASGGKESFRAAKTVTSTCRFRRRRLEKKAALLCRRPNGTVPLRTSLDGLQELERGLAVELLARLDVGDDDAPGAGENAPPVFVEARP